MVYKGTGRQFTFWNLLPRELKVLILENLDAKSSICSLLVCKEINSLIRSQSKKKIFKTIDFIKTDPFFISEAELAKIDWQVEIAKMDSRHHPEKIRFISPYKNYVNLFQVRGIDFFIWNKISPVYREVKNLFYQIMMEKF